MNSPNFLSSIAPFLNQFVQYKRALNRKYCADAEVLRLFDRYVQSRHITGWSAINSLVIDDFLRSHPRRVSARSYNHLLGTVHRFFKFAVMQQWIERNPVTASPRPETAARIPYLFDLETAKQLLAVARSFPERSRARYRGLVYETIFALPYGLGLRVRLNVHLVGAVRGHTFGQQASHRSDIGSDFLGLIFGNSIAERRQGQLLWFGICLNDNVG